MRRSLTILFILNLIAAGTLIVKVESLIEGVEVAADSLPRFVKELAKPDIDSSDRFQKLADHQVSSIERNRDYAQHVRVVVQLTALLLVINAAFFW